MCGITGFNFEVDENYIFNSLHHRGPDEKGKIKLNNFSFFHTRLSVQDITHGHQPFRFNEYVIVFNGEIYNHLKLRNLLKDFNFKTSSDTETLLYLFIKYKEKMFEKIDGMFAFAILNIKKNTLFLARDRAGKKPLFYYKKNEKFGFGSELNVFKFLDLDIDEDEIKLFLSTGFCSTPYKKIKEFPAGSFAYVNLDNLDMKIEKYFDIYDFYTKEKIDLNLEELDNILTKSVKDRLLASDVEVGAFLSGGIDSGLVVAKISEFKKIKTFTVRFEGSFDESNLAGLVAKKYGTEHYLIDIKMDVKNNIEKILTSYGKPFFDSSAIPSYFVSREARKYVKVVLNGDGADELFAGYRRYVPLALGLDNVAKNFKFLLPFLSPNSRGVKMFLYRLIRASSKKGIHWYNVLLNDLFEDIYEFKSKKIDDLDKFIKNVKLNNLDKLMYLDFVLNLIEDLVVKMDIATMINSLEARSPFLSKYFLEYAPLLKSKYKINFLTTKYALRFLAKKYLPQELVNAKKKGFEIPLTDWVNNELKDIIMDYLNYGFYKNFVDEKFVKKIINRKLNIPEEKRAKIIYLLFSLEVWRANENSVS
ncbi:MULTISPECIES: asparagine synthase (glutamine-hydrolyzing) [unclassified Lebetimonas]|uniref:asparagine synthase (glutamine-hydrolyzing) n=1 Tax=unclassified Lebetimonas TaxID=2648158 RepID=UPI0004647800|nr:MULTISPECIES: asparagine synthase (glutamine-hydrolyzing) [unclassified Lebetimonas]